MHRVARAACALIVVAGVAACASVEPRPAAASAGSVWVGSGELFDALVAIERRSWDAWKGHDGAFFSEVLADDHVDIGVGGPVSKKTVVAGVAGPFCTVRSFSVEGFRLLAVDARTAVLTYRARQDTSCGNFTVPSPTWVSSLYVKRDGRWQNLVFQQTQAQP